jgi:hypothetical protein
VHTLTLNHALTLAQSSGDSDWIWVLIQLAIVIVVFASFWQIFVKAGQPGWAGIVPIYNFYILTKIVGRPWWWLILMIIPLVGFIVAIMITHDLSKSFGKGIGFTVGMVLLPFVFYPLLAFGPAQYQGPAARR